MSATNSFQAVTCPECGQRTADPETHICPAEETESLTRSTAQPRQCRRCSQDAELNRVYCRSCADSLLLRSMKPRRARNASHFRQQAAEKREREREQRR